jgi:uncharacterized membrane protein
MNKEEEIKELREQVNRLSGEMSSQQERLYQLQSRLNELEKEFTTGTKRISQPDNRSLFSGEPMAGEKLNIENFIGVRLMHLVGIVVLVIGISIGVKYAVDRKLISEAARIALAYSAGLILFILSVRLKNKFELFSAILFSGAMASLYFTSYAAFVYYQLFPFGVAFFIMVAITVFTAYSAIKYNRQEIAILGMIGAYAIPFLISANSDKVYLFFAYILLINCGIAFLSFKKAWKAMILLAMLVSWALYLGWAFLRYNASHEMAAIIFMIAFYLLFCIASLAFPLLKRQSLQIIEVQHFVLNNVLFFTAALTVFTNSYFDKRSTEVTGFFCLFFIMESVLVRTMLNAEKLLFKYLIAMSVLCLVFYIGMKWDGIIVTILWIGMAIGLFISGVISKMAWLRLMAIVLTAATLMKLIFIDRENFSTVQKIISYIAIGALLLVLSFFYQKFRETIFSDKEK